MSKYIVGIAITILFIVVACEKTSDDFNVIEESSTEEIKWTVIQSI